VAYKQTMQSASEEEAGWIQCRVVECIGGDKNRCVAGATGRLTATLTMRAL
jgi:hypothetical protein